jgi:hypothetical protein
MQLQLALQRQLPGKLLQLQQQVGREWGSRGWWCHNWLPSKLQPVLQSSTSSSSSRSD